MKKLTNIILALAAVALNCGCINEEEFQKEDRSGIRVYSDLARTRTEHKSENGVTSISWVEGDRIGLSTSAQGNLGYIADNSGPTSEFTAADAAVQAAEGDVVYAYYPYDEWSWAGTETSFHLPHTQGQTYSTGLSYYDALYAKGTVADNELALHFKHVFAFLKITVPVNKLERDADSGCYVIRIISDQLISNIEGYYNIETSEFEADCTTDVMYWIDQDLEGQETVTITAAIMPQTCGTNIGIYAWFNNRAEELLRTITVPESGLQAGKIYTVTIRDEQQQDDKEKAVQALTALYYATDGDNWNNNTNWLSDEPLYKWYGLNANYWPEYTIEVDDIVEVQLFDNRLRGTLPSEFAYIMSKANSIEMHGNGLHGIIPQEVREHPKWQNFGWNILMQYPYWGGGFDFSEGTGLKLPDGQMTFFVEESESNVSDVLGANELTLIVNAGPVDELNGISDQLVSYFTQYKDMGLGMIVTVGGYWDYTYDEYERYVLEKRENGMPHEIRWSKTLVAELAGHSLSFNGSIHLFDTDANLLGVWFNDSTYPDGKSHLQKIDEIVRERLSDSPQVNQLTKVQSAYSNVASGTNSVTLNLSDGKWYSEIDTNTWETTYYGKGNYLAVDFYSEDGYLAPGIYRPSAVGDIINPGEYGIGYDPGDKWGIGFYFTDWGTCWWTVDQDAYPQTSAQKITSGDIVVELEGTVYTITVDNGEVKAKFVGEIPEVTNYDDPVYPSDPSDPWELEGDIVIERQGGLTYTMTDETANNFTINGDPLSGVTLYKVRINDAAGNDVAVLELVTEEGASSVTGEYRVTVYPDEVGEAGNGYDLSSWGIDISGGTTLYDNGNTYLIDADMSMIKIVEENGQITIIVKGTTNGTSIAAKYVILQTQENEDDYIDEYGINHGPGVEIDGVVWAPVNCGYHAEDYQWGKLYQWGRKYGQGYDGDAIATILAEGGVSVEEANLISNANVFYYGPSDWVDYPNDKLWNSGTESNPIKTEYDPCPAGWRVPSKEELEKLQQNSLWGQNEFGQYGRWFSGVTTYADNVPQVFFPASGRRTFNDGAAKNRSTVGYYLSSTPLNQNVNYLMLNTTRSRIYDYYRSYGYSVRCVKE